MLEDEKRYTKQLQEVLIKYTDKSLRFNDKAHGRADELLRKLAFLDDDGKRIGSRLVLGAFNREFFEDYVINAYSLSDSERENIRASYKEKHEFNQNQALFEAFNRIKLSIEERLDCCKNEEDAYEYLKALHMCLYDRFGCFSALIQSRKAFCFCTRIAVF